MRTTSSDTSVCDDFDQAHDADIIKGENNCDTGTDDSENNPDSTEGGSGSGSSSSQSGAANPSLFDPSTPLTGVWALVAALLFI